VIPLRAFELVRPGEPPGGADSLIEHLQTLSIVFLILVPLLVLAGGVFALMNLNRKMDNVGVDVRGNSELLDEVAGGIGDVEQRLGKLEAAVAGGSCQTSPTYADRKAIRAPHA
jgi:hypothetical protein